MAGSRKRLRRLQLDAETLDRLERAGLHTCHELLSVPWLELMERCNLSQSAAQAARTAAARALLPAVPTTALDKMRRLGNSGPCATGIGCVDSILRGGLPPGTITEVAGPAGSGKTQISTQLACQAALPASIGGWGKPVIYLDTEGAFSAQRLVEIAKHNHPGHFEDDMTELVPLVERVHVKVVKSTDDLLTTLEHLDEEVISTGAGLIVLDSAASLIRKEWASRSSTRRTEILNRQAAILKMLAEEFHIPVVVTNQVVTRFSGPDDEEAEAHVTAALGTCWAHSVNTRLVLEYDNDVRSGRWLRVVKSPMVPSGQPVALAVGAGGLEPRSGAGRYVQIDEANNPHINARAGAGVDAKAQHTVVFGVQ